MLRSIFPIDKVLRGSVINPGTLVTHDDLVSVICLGNESVERSILFQSLVTSNCDRRSVVYITNEPFDELPTQVEDMPSINPQYMEVVTFVYIKAAQQLTNYLAELHTLPLLPNVIVLQNISFFINQYQGDSLNTKFAMLMALIKESAKFLATKMGDVGEAKLFISMRPHEDHLTIFKKQFKNVWFISETSCPSEYEVKLQKGGVFHPYSLRFKSIGGSVYNPKFVN